MTERTGGCACGAVRFKITAALLGTGACHCTDCQKASGGAANYVALAPASAFEVTKGQPRVFDSKGDSGADVGRAFCADCGTPLWSTRPDMPFLPVYVAAFDDATDLAPQMHLYVSSAPKWHLMEEGLPKFPKMPPGPPPGR